MEFIPLFEVLGEPLTVTFGAAVIGLVFGIAAQHSGFCLRSAVLEATGHFRNRGNSRLVLWLLVFGVATTATQWLILSGTLDTGNLRQFTSARSLSGVLTGGLLFGAGMILTRGCVSRLTVLSASGNIRAVVTLLIFAVAAYETFAGFLEPLRQQILGLWTIVPSSELSLVSLTGLTSSAGMVIGAAITVGALILCWITRMGPAIIVSGLALGSTVAAGWWLTYTLSYQVFEPIAVESVSFIRPAIDVIQFGASGFVLNMLGFGIGILAGVLVGSFLAAMMSGNLKLEWFSSLPKLGRYALGAVMMGIGGVLAGGCSVGAGLTGGSLLAIMPLLALGAMIAGSAMMDFILHRIDSIRASRRTGVLPAE